MAEVDINWGRLPIVCFFVALMHSDAFKTGSPDTDEKEPCEKQKTYEEQERWLELEVPTNADS